VRATGFHVCHAAGDFLIPGFGDDFGRFFGFAFEADDKAK